MLALATSYAQNGCFILLITQPTEQIDPLNIRSQFRDFSKLGITLDCVHFERYFSVIMEKNLEKF